MLENKKGIELSVVEIIQLLWLKKIQILTVTILFTVLGIFFALSLPNKYQAEVMMIASEDGSGGSLSALAGQFGGLAGMAGINLSGKSDKKPKIALQILKSRSFLIEFIKKHKLEVLIFASEGWDAQQDKVILNSDLYNKDTAQWVRKYSFPKTQVPSEQEIYDKFVQMVDRKYDNLEGVYRLNVEFYSPNFAAQWANLLIADINEKMREVDIVQANKSISYLNVQLNKTNVHSTESVFFDLIEEQTKKAMLAQVQENYVFTIIDPALAPERKSEAKRALICILFMLLGSILSCGFMLIRLAVIKVKR